MAVSRSGILFEPALLTLFIVHDIFETGTLWLTGLCFGRYSEILDYHNVDETGNAINGS
jgi:hypothetical protein